MDNFKVIIGYFMEGFQKTMEILGHTIFHLGKTAFNLGLILYFISAIILLFFFSGKIKKLLIEKLLVKHTFDIGIRQSIGTITKYIIIVIGMIMIVQSVGIDLSALGYIAGALGVGIGFGLQNITNNFISGLIILFERPVKVGDRIEVGTIKGNVVNIAARATTVLTNDNISVIVPNSEFISSRVVNWSYNDRKVALNYPVSVSIRENPEVVRDILLLVAHENRGVLRDPEPKVLFDSFAENSLNFILRVWTTQFCTQPGTLKSLLYFEIFRKFKEHHIEISQKEMILKTEHENGSLNGSLTAVNPVSS